MHEDTPIEGLRETTNVGDLNSNARGSGARKNEGKAQLDLIPVRFWIDSFRFFSSYYDGIPPMWWTGLEALMRFQEGEDHAIREFLAYRDLRPAVEVFEFGARKYKAWNWAKGMPWSVCFGCCLRHAEKRLVQNKLLDDDSGHTHWGHFLCNLIMLAWYVDAYPEGDDRPLFEEQ